MAARIIQRTFRMVAVPVSFQPLAASVPSECKRLVQFAPSSPCQAALHTSSMCHLAQSFLDISKTVNPDSSKTFRIMLTEAQNIDELLKIGSRQNIDVNQLVMIIQEITKRAGQNTEEILKDERFLSLLGFTDSKMKFIWNPYLVMLLQSMYRLKMDSKSHVLQSVETEVLWRLPRLSMKSLSFLAKCIPQTPSDGQIPLLNDLVKQVQLRWMEISDRRSAIHLKCKLTSVPDSLMEKLEDKVLEYSTEMTPVECCQVLQVLSKQNRRPYSLVQALSSNLMESDMKHCPEIVCETAWALARLNFCIPSLFTKLAIDVIPSLSALKVPYIGMLTWSYGKLRFFYPPLLEALAREHVECVKKFNTEHYCLLYKTCANFNFVPAESKDLFKLIDEDLDSLKQFLQIDVVWSLCVLGCATTMHFQKILDPQFVDRFLSESNLTRSNAKLMNINGCIQLENPNFEGKLLSQDVLQTLWNRNMPFESRPFHGEVKATAQAIFPNPKSLAFKTPNIYGLNIEIEAVLDSKLNALPINDFVAPYSLEPRGTKPLPDGARRFVIIGRDFSQYMYRSKNLMGGTFLFRRLLQGAGFLVVEVPYYEWYNIKGDEKKKMYLMNQLKKVLEEDLKR